MRVDSGLQEEGYDAAMPRSAKRVVLEVGGEGGSITLTRDRSGGQARYFLEREESAMWSLLDEDDGGPPPPPPPPPELVGTTLAEALEALARYPWFWLVPLEVDPKLAAEIEAQVLARGGEKALARWRAWPGR